MPVPASDRPDRSGAQTLERGLAVLSELGLHHEGLSASEVATACRLHRSVTNRLLVSLVRTGFVARTGAGRYVVGPAVGRLTGPTRLRLRDVARPVLHRLAQEVDATASLVEVADGAAVTTVVAEPPTDGPRFSYRLGDRAPLDRGAGGLAALASGPARAGEPARVAGVRSTGSVVTHEELNPGAHGLAAPLPGWEVLAAVTVVTAVERTTADGLPYLLRAVRDIGLPVSVG